MSKIKKNQIEKTEKTSNLEIARDLLPKSHGYIYKGDDDSLKCTFIKTNIISVDELLGGGFPEGKIIEIYGGFGTGKTTLALQIVISLQKENKTILYIDMENTFNREYAEKLGVNLNNILIYNPTSGEKAFEYLEKLIREGLVDMVIFDSVAAMISEPDLEDEKFSVRIGGQSRMMSVGLKKLNSLCLVSKKQVTSIFLNQIRNKINTMGFGSPETTSGGVALSFYASLRIKLTNVGQLKNSFGTYGNLIKISVTKNRFSKPNLSVEIPMIYGYGFDKTMDMINNAINLKIIQKNGAWFYFEENSIGNGIENVIKNLKENKDLENKIREKLLKQISEVISSSVETSNE